jgi:hypothetical protein
MMLVPFKKKKRAKATKLTEESGKRQCVACGTIV